MCCGRLLSSQHHLESIVVSRHDFLRHCLLNITRRSATGSKLAVYSMRNGRHGAALPVSQFTQQGDKGSFNHLEEQDHGIISKIKRAFRPGLSVSAF